jgi:hypothetical protein
VALNSEAAPIIPSRFRADQPAVGRAISEKPPSGVDGFLDDLGRLGADDTAPSNGLTERPPPMIFEPSDPVAHAGYARSGHRPAPGSYDAGHSDTYFTVTGLVKARSVRRNRSATCLTYREPKWGRRSGQVFVPSRLARSRLRILPVMVSGNSATNSISRGAS